MSKLVELGQVIGRIVSMETVILLGATDFRKDLIENALTVLRSDIAGLMGHFHADEPTLVVAEYQQDSSWLHVSGKR